MKHLKNLCILAIIAVMFTACFNYDTPPRQEPVIIDPAHVITIAELQGLFRNQETPQALTIRDSVVLPDRVVRDSVFISGQVISSDRDGNIFREMFIQDETGGLRIRVGRSGLYNFYPLGQHVFIRLQGLTIGNNNGTLELGVRSANFTTGFIDVPWLINHHVLSGPQDTLVEPRIFTLAQLNDATFRTNYIGTLVKIENVRFSHTTEGTGSRPFGQLSTWANPFPADGGAPQSVNQNFVDENGQNIIIRTSGHARFAGDFIPRCVVDIVGVLTVFGGNSQMFIRSLNDVTPSEIYYTITIVPPTNGTIVVMDGNDEIESGDTRRGCTVLTLTATPDEGYRLYQWWDGNTQLQRTGVLVGNLTVSAIFVPISESSE